MSESVKTITYKGKPYVEVAERVRQVHDKKLTFEVTESEPLTIGERVIWRVTIVVDGKTYKGCAEAKLNAAKDAPKSADGTNPFECAETSALGRALAFAGFGTVDGIASYDEVARGVSFDQLRPASPPQNAKPAPRRPDAAPAIRESNDLASIPPASRTRKEVEQLGKTWEDFLKWAFEAYIKSGKTKLDVLLASGDELPPSYCRVAAAKLAELKAEEKPAA